MRRAPGPRMELPCRGRQKYQQQTSDEFARQSLALKANGLKHRTSVPSFDHKLVIPRDFTFSDRPEAPEPVQEPEAEAPAPTKRGKQDLSQSEDP